MAVIVDSGSIFDYEIYWSTGQSHIELLSMDPGFYSVIVRDSNGCRQYASAELHDPDSIFISSINTTPADSGSPGNIVIVASAGGDTLLYSIDGVNYQSMAIFSVPANGYYSAYVKNSSGCVVQQAVLVSIHEWEENFGWHLYPNPVQTELMIQGAIANATLSVYDLQGREVYEAVPATSSFKLQTSTLENGVYLLRLGNTSRRFVVMH
jgi:hypothetical protein